MKVFVLLLAVIGAAQAANLDRAPNRQASLIAEQGGVPTGDVGALIVAGVTTPIIDVSYIVAMLRTLLGSTSLRCGGSIISPVKIVSAAHCVYEWIIVWRKIPPTQLKFRAGSADSTTGGQLIPVESFVAHPNFNHNTQDNDVTVLHLASPLILSPTVATIALPAQNADVAAGTLVQVAGWGALQEGGSSSTTSLQAVSVPVVPNADCNTKYGGRITDGMLCAGLQEGGKDACQGDSGGPLSYDGKLYGIVSWGQGCAQAGFPGVYTRVAFYSQWITAN